MPSSQGRPACSKPIRRAPVSGAQARPTRGSVAYVSNSGLLGVSPRPLSTTRHWFGSHWALTLNRLPTVHVSAFSGRFRVLGGPRRGRTLQHSALRGESGDQTSHPPAHPRVLDHRRSTRPQDQHRLTLPFPKRAKLSDESRSIRVWHVLSRRIESWTPYSGEVPEYIPAQVPPLLPRGRCTRLSGRFPPQARADIRQYHPFSKPSSPPSLLGPLFTSRRLT